MKRPQPSCLLRSRIAPHTDASITMVLFLTQAGRRCGVVGPLPAPRSLDSHHSQALQDALQRHSRSQLPKAAAPPSPEQGQGQQQQATLSQQAAAALGARLPCAQLPPLKPLGEVAPWQGACTRPQLEPQRLPLEEEPQETVLPAALLRGCRTPAHSGLLVGGGGAAAVDVPVLTDPRTSSGKVGARALACG